MISRRELIRRALGLPLVAGLAAVVTRKRGPSWLIGRCDAKRCEIIRTLPGAWIQFRDPAGGYGRVRAGGIYTIDYRNGVVELVGMGGRPDEITVTYI